MSCVQRPAKGKPLILVLICVAEYSSMSLADGYLLSWLCVPRAALGTTGGPRRVKKKGVVHSAVELPCIHELRSPLPFAV